VLDFFVLTWDSPPEQSTWHRSRGDLCGLHHNWIYAILTRVVMTNEISYEQQRLQNIK